MVTLPSNNVGELNDTVCRAQARLGHRHLGQLVCIDPNSNLFALWSSDLKTNVTTCKRGTSYTFYQKAEIRPIRETNFSSMVGLYVVFLGFLLIIYIDKYRPYQPYVSPFCIQLRTIFILTLQPPTVFTHSLPPRTIFTYWS